MEPEHPRKDSAINYIEFNVADVERAKKFYGGAFGWTFTDYGPDYCEFTDGHMTGGFSKGDVASSGGPLVVLYGDDLNALMERVKSAGGKIAQPVFDFPGGQRFHFTDPDGYELAIWSMV